MNKNQTKQFSISFKICATMIICLVVTATILLSCLVPRYSTLVTNTTNKGMVDYASLYAQIVDNALTNLSSSMRNSRPLMMQVNTSSADQDDASNDGMLSVEGNEGTPEGSMMLPPGDNNHLATLLQEYTEYVSVIRYATLDGNIVAASDDMNIGTNIGNESYFQAIVSGNSYAMSDTIITDNGTEFILSFSTLDSKGELCAVTTATITSSYLSKVLSSYTSEKVTAESGMQLISGTSVFDTKNSVVYVCDQNGIVLTASNPDWVGFDITQGETVSLADRTSSHEGHMSYDADGAEYYMAYSHVGKANWLCAVDVSTAEIFSSLNSARILVGVLAVILLIVATLLSYAAARSITKPIKKTTETLEYLSELELNKIDLNDIKRNNDETGTMLHSIESAVEKIKNVVASIESSSDAVYTNAKQLSTISEQLQVNAAENSQISEELSAGMEETAAVQEQIRQDITSIQDNSNAIKDKINDGVASCKQIITAANELNRDTVRSSEVTKGIYHDVKLDVAKALERAKAVEKINLMTDSIMDIASQTSLLALNASIEAARAGDAGRGFAIVAEQIGTLANQSSDTVSNISGIIDEVNGAVTDMTSSLEKTLSFMETQILNDYAKFINVSTEYSDNSTLLRNDMTEIAESITAFMTTLQSMSQSIKESADTLEVASENTISLTEKNNQVASIAVDTNQMANDSTNSAEELNEIIKIFKL